MFNFKDIADDFLGLFFPRLCVSCSESLVRGELIMCTQCLVSIARTDYHMKHDNALEKAFWGRCSIERAAAFSVYNRGSRIRKMIHLLKYRGRKDVGHYIGYLYGTSIAGSEFMSGIDMIIPVPLHPARLRKRGYNQSEYIARGLSDATGVPVRNGILARVAETSTQTKRGRYERWENVSGRFTVKDTSAIAGKHLLVLDDVITTGSTMEACVQALQEAAQVRVSIIAMAAAQKLTL